MKKNFLVILVSIVIILISIICTFLLTKKYYSSENTQNKEKDDNLSYFVLTRSTEGLEIKEYYLFNKDGIENKYIMVLQYSEESKEAYNEMKGSDSYENITYNDQTYTVVVLRDSGDWSKQERLEMLERQVITNSNEECTISLEKF